jgi:hypothetical protein
LHIPGLALDGRLGQDVIQIARNAIGLALATEKFGGKFFGNGAVGMGVFEYPTIMPPEDYERTKRSIQESWGGENALRPLLLEAGMKYTPTTVPPNEGQFLETREHQVVEVCRIFNVPPHMAGVTEKSNRANTEQIGQEFVTFSLRPDLEAWQQEVVRKLFPRSKVGRNAGRKFGMFFDTWPLVVPAANDLRQFIASMIQFGVFEPNDARERLRMNPLEGDENDATYLPINIAPASKVFENPALPDNSPEPAGDDAKPKSKKKPKGVGGMQQAYSRLFRDAFGRISARDRCDLAAFKRAFLPLLTTIFAEADVEASAELGISPDPAESSFVAEYLSTMHHRYSAEGWSRSNGRADEICTRELARAVKALSVEAYRAAATRLACEQAETFEEVES